MYWFIYICFSLAPFTQHSCYEYNCKPILNKYEYSQLYYKKKFTQLTLSNYFIIWISI